MSAHTSALRMLRGRPVRFVRAGQLPAPGARVELIGPEEAKRFLRPLLADPQERVALRRRAAELLPGVPARDDVELLARLVSALVSGRLALEWAAPRAIAHLGGGREPERRDAADEPELVWNRGSETEWIEVVLTDERGEPVAGLRYRIVAPDGREHRGRTDAFGAVRLTQIPGGDCTVTFLRDEPG